MIHFKSFLRSSKTLYTHYIKITLFFKAPWKQFVKKRINIYYDILYLVECVTNDFNVHLVQVLFRYTVLEKCS